MKRFYGIIVALIGVAILAMGIVFLAQANTAKKTVADEISPVTLSNLIPSIIPSRPRKKSRWRLRNPDTGRSSRTQRDVQLSFRTKGIIGVSQI